MYACVLVFVIICDIFCCKIEVFRIFLDCCSVAFFCQLIFVECVIIIVIVILFINLWQILVVIFVRIVFARVVCSKFKTGLFCFGLKFCKIASIHAPFEISNTSNPSATFFSYIPPTLCNLSLGKVVVLMSNPLCMIS